MELQGGSQARSVLHDPIERARGIDARGIEARGIEARGIDARGTDARGIDARGIDARGIEARGIDARGTDARGTDARGIDARGTDARGTDATVHVNVIPACVIPNSNSNLHPLYFPPSSFLLLFSSPRTHFCPSLFCASITSLLLRVINLPGITNLASMTSLKSLL